MPSSLADAVRLAPVCTLIAVIEAFGMTEPFMSVTIPSISASSACDWAKFETIWVEKTKANPKKSDKNGFESIFVILVPRVTENAPV